MSKMSKYEEGPVPLQKGMVIGKDWKVIKKLGEGGCGAVYQVENVTSNVIAALKAESNFVEGGAVLKIEVGILTRLKGKKHVAELFHAGKKEKFQYMVMSLLGESLNNLLKKCGKQVSVASTLRVGAHVLHGLKALHDIAFIHRDIKPANLAVGKEGSTDPNMIFILDFGLSREFAVVKNGETKLRKPRKHALFRGTTRYCSVATHEKAEQGRCDDLWSLLYVMAELRNRLPWAPIKEKKEIMECKKKTSDAELLAKCSSHLIAFAAHLRQLDYWTRPDYLLLYNLLVEAMHDGGYRWSDPWDWDMQQPGVLGKKLARVMPSSSSLASAIDKTDKPSKINDKSSAADLKTTADDDKTPFPEEDFSCDPLGF